MDQEILDRGQVSGAVLYNQGNAFMQAGQRGRAIAAYRQARRYQGPDPFLEANLAYAGRANRPCIAARWSSTCSSGKTGSVTLRSFSRRPGAWEPPFCWPAAMSLVRRRWLTRLTLAGLAASLLLIYRPAYDWYRYEWNIHGVIVQKQTIVRKETPRVTSRP